MAELKTTTALSTQQERMKSLETAISGIEKQFGKGAVMRGSAYIKNRNEEQTNQD